MMYHKKSEKENEVEANEREKALNRMLKHAAKRSPIMISNYFKVFLPPKPCFIVNKEFL